MSRITLHVELEKDDIFVKELRASLEGEAKSMAREAVTKVFEPEIERIIHRRAGLLLNGKNTYDPEVQAFKKQIHQKLQNAMLEAVNSEFCAALIENSIRQTEEKTRRFIETKAEMVDACIERIIRDEVRKIAEGKLISSVLRELYKGGAEE